MVLADPAGVIAGQAPHDGRHVLHNQQLLVPSCFGLHSKPMFMGSLITVVFCCSKCTAGYQANQVRRSERLSRIVGSYRCDVCSTEVSSWDGDYDYRDWKAIDL
jgi:hypothetical protein